MSLKLLDSNAWYGLLFAFHINYGCILYYLRDKAIYWSRIVIFYTPLHSTLPLGSSRRTVAILFGAEKKLGCVATGL